MTISPETIETKKIETDQLVQLHKNCMCADCKKYRKHPMGYPRLIAAAPAPPPPPLLLPFPDEHPFYT